MIITKKQICLLLICIIPSSKLLILPTVFAYFAKEDAWLSAFFCFALDGLMLGATLIAIKKFDGNTFFDVLAKSFSKGFARAVYFAYAIYFLLKAVVPIFEQKMFIEITLYETAPSVLTFLPFFIISFYLCFKGVNTFARSGEMIFYLTAFGLALTIFLSLGTTRLYYLRPMLKNPVFQTIKGSYSGIIWFGQPLILLFFAGRIKKERRFNLSIIISYVVCSLVGIMLFAIFTGVYGDIAVRQIYSLTKMTKYAIALSNVGRFDYLATMLLVASSVISLSAPLVMAADCLSFIFDKKHVLLISFVCNTLMLISVAIFHMRFQSVLNFFEAFFAPVMIFMAYAVPLITIIFKRRSTRALFEK